MAGLSKEEYLKRYLSPANDEQKLKKKRKKKSSGKPIRKECGMKIVDDDVGWDSFAPKADEFDEVDNKLLTEEERPQIENIDVRTKEEKKLDEYRRSLMWKKLGTDEQQNTENLSSGKTKSNYDIPKNKSNSSRKKRHDSDSDLDISRNNSSSSKRRRHDSDSDLDIPRNKLNSQHKRHDSDSDLEISRNKRSVGRKRHDSDSDLDIPRNKPSSRRKRHDSDSDLEVERNVPVRDDAIKKQQSQMQSGGRGGLTSVDLLRLEMDKLKKKETEVQKMAQQYKDSTTIYRERGTGKKRDTSKEQKETEEELERKKKKEAQYDKWGKGLKQAEMTSNMIADAVHESNKSFTRYADDEDLETMRKEAVRDGDPMAEYIARKKRKEKADTNEYPKYKGPAPAPNRYKMMPGYRWDGVDRSNGFEEKYFQTLSDNQALKDEYYKWSVGDM